MLDNTVNNDAYILQYASDTKYVLSTTEDRIIFNLKHNTGLTHKRYNALLSEHYMLYGKDGLINIAESIKRDNILRLSGNRIIVKKALDILEKFTIEITPHEAKIKSLEYRVKVLDEHNKSLIIECDNLCKHRVKLLKSVGEFQNMSIWGFIKYKLGKAWQK